MNQSGGVSEEKCTVCGSANNNKISRKEILSHPQSGTRYPLKDLTYLRCNECNTRYRTNIDYGQLGTLYSGEYKKTYGLKKRVLLRLPFSSHYKDKIAFIKNVPPGTLLDVGCSEGKYMWLMKRRGWSVEGIEPSNCAEFARKFYKHIVHRSTLELFKPPQKYDMVTCFGTLEHVFHPKKFIFHLKKCVAKGGRLFIVVPTRSYAVEHLTFFSPYSITILLKNAGFEVEKLEYQKGKRGEKIYVLAKRE